MQWKCNYFSRIRPQSHGSRGRSLTPGHLQVMKEKSVFPEWLLEFAGCRWEISDGAAPKTFLRLLWSLADLHGHPSFAYKTPVFMQTSTRKQSWGETWESATQNQKSRPFTFKVKASLLKCVGFRRKAQLLLWRWAFSASSLLCSPHSFTTT